MRPQTIRISVGQSQGAPLKSSENQTMRPLPVRQIKRTRHLRRSNEDGRTERVSGCGGGGEERRRKRGGEKRRKGRRKLLRRCRARLMCFTGRGREEDALCLVFATF